MAGVRLSGVVAKAPMRIALGGGGTDLPSYSERFGGCVLSAAIDKYVYANANGESYSDLPSGIGLGGSGAYWVAVHAARAAEDGFNKGKMELAEKAWNEERDRGIGIHDQLVAVNGGIRMYSMVGSSVTWIETVNLPDCVIPWFENRLRLYGPIKTHSTSDVLRDQIDKTNDSDAKTIQRLCRIKRLARTAYNSLKSLQWDSFADTIHYHWMLKRELSASITDSEIDSIWRAGMDAGADAGKLVGAGGGGCMLFVVLDDSNVEPVDSAMKSFGLERIKFSFAMEGVCVH